MNCKGQPKLFYSLKKYGWGEHKFEIICECDIDNLNKLETYFIKFYDTFNTEHGMNLINGGARKMFSDESKKKMSYNAKNRKYSKETRAKLSNALKGIKRSEETLKKMSLCKTGLKHTNETKLKISKNKSGTYEIYDNNNKLFHKVHGNIKKELKLFNFPEHRFCNSYRDNEKIKGGSYKDWYVIKLP
ncbi:MAG: NUMOD3 domain-containing DNA-binding protein [Bacteroidales bacterium]|jgi:coenzyme F420-reducing hydrogenase alpha subunit|nr:NUMOD3 domain-containing DNA-binding protein [Bacteroidales bacterium]